MHSLPLLNPFHSAPAEECFIPDGISPNQMRNIDMWDVLCVTVCFICCATCRLIFELLIGASSVSIKEKVGSCTVIMPNETSYLVTNSSGGAPRD